MANIREMEAIALEIAPHQVTLVPENRKELTTEGGLDVSEAKQLEPVLRRLSAAGIRTSLFIDPEPDSVRRSADLRVDAVELHTGEYANSDEAGRAEQLDRLEAATSLGRELGLAVHAGHGLTYENVAAVAAIEDCEELNIGHSVVSRSIFVGIETAVRELKSIIQEARLESTGGCP